MLWTRSSACINALPTDLDVGKAALAIASPTSVNPDPIRDFQDFVDYQSDDSQSSEEVNAAFDAYINRIEPPDVPIQLQFQQMSLLNKRR